MNLTQPRKLLSSDRRIASPILTPDGLAALEGMAASTAYQWVRSGIVATRPNLRRGWATIPLLGLADGHLTRLMRQTLPMEEVRAVLHAIREAGPGGYASLSERLMTDGLHAYLTSEEGTARLVGHQLAIEPVLSAFSTRLLLDDSGVVDRYVVDRVPGVVIRPGVNSGRMSFERTGVPVFAIAGALRHAAAKSVADEYEVPVEHVEAVAEVDPEWLSRAA